MTRRQQDKPHINKLLTDAAQSRLDPPDPTRTLQRLYLIGIALGLAQAHNFRIEADHARSLAYEILHPTQEATP